MPWIGLQYVIVVVPDFPGHKPQDIFSHVMVHQASRLECVFKNVFSYFSIKTYVVGTLKSHLNPKQMFKVMDKKIFTILCQKIVFISTHALCIKYIMSLSASEKICAFRT